MSRFGMEQLEKFDPLYVPHGVDTSVYAPMDKKKAREGLGLPEDAFLIGVVAANKGNPSRKSFPEILQAFKVFRERHSEAILYLHTEISGISDGVSLPMLINSLDIPADAIRFADQYKSRFNPVSPKTMAKIYSTFDVLLSPSRAEGFGVPILEAQSCGVPAIVTNFSVCGAGWKVDFEPEWTGQMSWQARPSIESILEALEARFGQSTHEQTVMSEAARKHALEYDAAKVFAENMLPALDEAQARFDARKPVQVAV